MRDGGIICTIQVAEKKNYKPSKPSFYKILTSHVQTLKPQKISSNIHATTTYSATYK